MTRRATSYAVAAMTAGGDDAGGGGEYVELARATSERGEVVLRERREAAQDPTAGARGPAVLELRVNGVFVMDSLETSTEQALATAALAQVDEPRDVLVGGLGLGFTTHAVLMDRRVERLVVVEVEEALVAWMRDGTVPHGPEYLADQRLTVVVADIRQAVLEAMTVAFGHATPIPLDVSLQSRDEQYFLYLAHR